MKKMLLFVFAVTICSVLGLIAMNDAAPDAKCCQATTTTQFLWSKDLLSRYQWNGDELVVDIGCGLGVSSAFICERVPHGSVLALDTSQEVIDDAQKIYTTQNFPRIIFLCGQITDVVMKENVDLAFAGCSLHKLSKERHFEALKRILVNLKPGGKLLIVEPEASKNSVFSFAQELSNTPKWKPFFTKFDPCRSCYTQEEYCQLLENIGFEIIEVKKVSVTKKCAMEALAGQMLACSPYVQCFKPGYRFDFLNDLFALVINHNQPDSEGMVTLNVMRLEIVARKPQ